MIKNFRVVHLPSTVGGNPQSLSRHLRGLGIQSESWAFTQNYFGYDTDKIITSSRSRLLREFAKIIALRYIFKFDIIFFNFGTSLYTPFLTVSSSYKNSRRKTFLGTCHAKYSHLMASFEIFLLNFLKKPIFIQYQGDDARQGDFCISEFPITFANRVEVGYYSEASDEAKRKRIEFYSRHAKKIYALNPDLLHVLPLNAEFLPYSHISLSEWSPVFNQTDDRPLRIGHAPSHRLVKGTDLILKAVEQLKKNGYEFEFVLVEGKSNKEAKEIYKTIHVLIDQLFAGWYGGLAVEAMAMGKPVVAYIRPDDLQFVPAAMAADLPIIEAQPHNIYRTLVKVVTMPRLELLNLAKKSRQYVEKWHDPVKIAQRIESDMKIAIGAVL